MIKSIILAMLVTYMFSRINREIPNTNANIRISHAIISIIVFTINFLISSALGNNNNVLDYYTYLQFSLIISKLVYCNLV